MDRVLYLAVSFDVYEDFFAGSFIQEIIAEHQVKLVVFSQNKEEIAVWID